MYNGDNTENPKKICITGERCTSKFYDKIYEDIQSATLNNTCLFVFGDCSGVDTCARQICHLLQVSFIVYSADRNKYGNAAGPIRNAQMIDYIADSPNSEVWAYHSDLNRSKGTKNTVKLARQKKLKISIYEKD